MNPMKLLKAVKALSGWRETAFLLALVERNLPNAILFLESTDRLSSPDHDVPLDLPALLAESWACAVMSQNEERVVDVLDSIIGLLVEDDVDSFGVIPCNNTLELWESALVSALNRDKKRAEDGSQLSINTVSAFIEFTEGEGLDENALIKLFERHDLMAREFSFQKELCDILRAADKLSSELVRSVRGLARDEGISNLGISLEEDA